VFLKSFGGSKEEGEKNEWDDDNAGNDVGNENEEVHRANEALARELGVAVVIMVKEVADQKESGTQGGEDHAGGVGFGFLFFDAVHSDGDQGGTEPVEAGVHKGQGFDDVVVGMAGGLPEIDVPDQKDDDGSTEPEDETNGGFITDVV